MNSFRILIVIYFLVLTSLAFALEPKRTLRKGHVKKAKVVRKHRAAAKARPKPVSQPTPVESLVIDPTNIAPIDEVSESSSAEPVE